MILGVKTSLALLLGAMVVVLLATVIVARFTELGNAMSRPLHHTDDLVQTKTALALVAEQHPAFGKLAVFRESQPTRLGAALERELFLIMGHEDASGYPRWHSLRSLIGDPHRGTALVAWLTSNAWLCYAVIEIGAILDASCMPTMADDIAWRRRFESSEGASTVRVYGVAGNSVRQIHVVDGSNPEASRRERNGFYYARSGDSVKKSDVTALLVTRRNGAIDRTEIR